MVLSVRDVEELIFCPRLFYYHVVLGIERFYGFWVETGKTFENEMKEKVKKNFEKEYYILEEKIYESKRLNLKGKPDLVLKHKKYNHYAIVEIKNSKRAKPEFLGTMFVYSILLEDCGIFPVKEAYLILKNNILKFNISDFDREKAEFYIKHALEILRGKIPKGNTKNCILCDLRGVCDEGYPHNK